MTRNQAEYPINELAKKTNVSVRTIRFYINEGLLPAPETRGRYTAYTDEYVDRLELIRRLKEAFLPLKEIRATLASLSWEDVRLTLDDLRGREAQAQQAPPGDDKGAAPRKVGEPRSSALEYISGLLTSTPVSRPLPPQPPRPSPQAGPGGPPAAQTETWQRVTLADGLELHIRKPLRPENQRKMDEIIELVRKKFNT